MSTRILLAVTNNFNSPYLHPGVMEGLAGVVARASDDTIKRFGGSALTCPLYFFNHITDFDIPRMGASTFNEVETCYWSVVNDRTTYYLLDRRATLRRNRTFDLYKNGFNYSGFLVEATCRTYDLLSHARTDMIFFTSIPHDIDSWIVFHAAYHIGIPVFVVSESGLPWRAVVREIVPDRVQGYREKACYPQDPSVSDAQPSTETVQYIATKRQGYEVAEPGYMAAQRVNLVARSKRSLHRAGRILRDRQWNRLVRVFRWDRAVDKVGRVVRKRHLWRVLQARAHAAVPDFPYIAVFLHYQPERTSVPEGGRYAQQWVAIAALLDRMPDGWRLVVKEHPATFRVEMPRPFRHPGFYKLIERSNNANLIDPKVDSFYLLDHAEAVVTLTGRVGFEAICRGVPAIVLGDARYKTYPGVIDLSNTPMAECDLHKLITEARAKIRVEGAIEAHSSDIESQSFGGTFSIDTEGRLPETINRETMTEALEWVMGRL